MMKYLFTIIVMLMFVGCKKEKPQKQENNNRIYYIPVEGSQIYMKIDRKSTIEELIPRLRTNHELYETGKGYWIGYNDLMFSIAVHSDSAIAPLLNFIDTTNCKL